MFFSYYTNVSTLSMFRAVISVVYPYLIVTYLNSSEAQLGIFQTVILTLGVLLGPVSGYLSDRSNPAKLLVRLQFLSIFPLAILMIAISMSAVTYELVLALGVLGFAALGMTQPPLDVLVHMLGDESIQKRISGSLFLGYITSAIGYTLAASTDLVGVPPVVFLMISLLCIGSFLSQKFVDKYSGEPADQTKLNSKRDFWGGYKYVFRSPQARPTVVLMGLAGFLLGGPIGVMVPLLLRDEYAGSALQFALVYGTFMMGGAASNAVLGMIKGVVMTGMTLGLGFLLCAIALAIWAVETNFPIFVLGAWIWGAGGGICMCMSRTIVQINVSEAVRGRALSAMYSLDEGAAPFGAMAAGLIAHWWGARELAIVCGVGTVVCLLVVFAVSPSLRSERDISSTKNGAGLTRQDR